nr:uncharacterized protein C10orf95-like [Mirounga angustirostris]
MPPFLEPAVPAAKEDDGGDGAQQKQQEEEGTLDAVGSQQDEESRGNHGAGEAGAARRRGWRAAAQAPVPGAPRSGGHGRARLSASCPALAAPRPAQWLRTPRQPRYASDPGLRGALAMTQQTATRQGLGGGEPIPSLPRRPRPRPCAAPGRSPAGDAAGWEEQHCRCGHTGPAHRLAAATGLGIPEAGRTWVGAGTRRRAAAAAARGGREWGAAAGARLMTSRPGCGNAGARTWLRRLRRRPRAAPGPECPAPSRGAARQYARSADAQTPRLSAPRHPGLPPIQPPWAELLGSPATGGAKEPGGKP